VIYDVWCMVREWHRVRTGERGDGWSYLAVEIARTERMDSILAKVAESGPTAVLSAEELSEWADFEEKLSQGLT
jgi:hypothetical protein